MTETVEGDVLHAIPPDELGEHDLEPTLEELAAGQYVLVCRRGGHPSMFQLLWAFIKRKPLEAVTVVSAEPAEEGDSVSLTVEETTMTGVYRVI
ncbi:hypothetical protein [Halolamina sp.]|jgi:hypothetical protein|uniref:DUF7526 family protein n=1 Tax=Halolamina sp. TaxID=1940283 RepID=UPI000223B897|nr:hypothetical protein Halar_0824 [halophilic archaeon DL31]